MAGLFRIEIQNGQMLVLLDRARLNLTSSQLTQLGHALRDGAERVRTRAVRNVSGYPVQYEGQVFRVMVRTDTLRHSMEMQWPYQSPLQARVYVNGAHTSQPTIIGGVIIAKARPVSEYAAAIEFGHAEIDLKQFMMGKTVPFFAARSQSARGPYAAAGLDPLNGPNGDEWVNKDLNSRLAAKGKGPMVFGRQRTKAAYAGQKGGGGSYYIAFRKVGKTGWVIPAAKPRPFMRAALKQSERDVRSLTYQELMTILNPAHP